MLILCCLASTFTDLIEEGLKPTLIGMDASRMQSSLFIHSNIIYMQINDEFLMKIFPLMNSSWHYQFVLTAQKIFFIIIKKYVKCP
jgi:hypothetical protein